MAPTMPHVVAHPWGCICGVVQGRKQWALVGHQSLFAGIEIRPLNRRMSKILKLFD